MKRKAPPSPKRDQVSELLSEGLEFDQIAERVGITVKAVRRHFENIREGLGVQAC
jgi:DNA-binding NarL/FixJ family response regulator